MRLGNRSDRCTDRTAVFGAEYRPDCKSKYTDEDGVTSEEACPAACGICCDSSLVDSTSWYFKKSKYTCAKKVVDDPDKYCKSKYIDDNGVSSSEACASTCGNGCAPVDSTSWYYKKQKKTCESYISKKSKYCKSKYVDDAGVTSAEACPATCADA